MMQEAYTQLQTRLQAEPKTWLVTGVAGFIGSNLLETLLKLAQLQRFDAPVIDLDSALQRAAQYQRSVIASAAIHLGRVTISS